MIDIWNHAVRSIRENKPTVLVVVVDHTGSVPGTTGAMMVVSELGCAGTVGGGVGENEMIERSRGFQGRSELVVIEHTPNGSGSLCRGRHTLAMVSLGEDDIPTLNAITSTLNADRIGALAVSQAGIAFEPGQFVSQEFLESEDGWRFATTVGRLETLYIAGGGHVSLALSRVMAPLPFRIVVLDNRPELPTMATNEYAHEAQVIDYEDIADHVEEGDRSWVVIMTYGHEHDAVVVRQLTGKPLRYLGLMGSASKVKQMFARFQEEGISADQLERVSAPIGLPIGSHTPEEIAISIAAEIVQLRNRSE